MKKVKVLWRINGQCDNVIKARRPVIIVIDKKGQTGIISDIAILAEVKIGGKERKKVVPAVIGAFESVTKEFNKWIENLEIGNIKC